MQDSPNAAAQSAFVFATCQVGAESALKSEIARQDAGFRQSFSRPGFLTFKLPAGQPIPDGYVLESVFARASGVSLGKASGEMSEEIAQHVWRLVDRRRVDRVHVWERDRALPGLRGFEPGPTLLAHESRQAILKEHPVTAHRDALQRAETCPGDWVLDCVLVEPGEWWVGYHRAGSIESCWPGGAPGLSMPEQAVSRAFLKIQEAILWSGFPLWRGDRVAEIGCSPGGASQALLDRGLHVLGIDPAEVDPRLLEQPRFTYVRKRGAEVRKREFRDVRWLVADINLAPKYTLDTVESIVTNSAVKIEGMLLTLKLLKWELAEHLPEYLERVRGWGYHFVRARQLAHNRREICLAAAWSERVFQRSGRSAHSRTSRD